MKTSLGFHVARRNLNACELFLSLFVGLWCSGCAYGVVVSMFDFHRSDRGSNPGRGGEKFHNVYDYNIERHPRQVSENHKPRVIPKACEGNWVVRLVPDETQD